MAPRALLTLVLAAACALEAAAFAGGRGFNPIGIGGLRPTRASAGACLACKSLVALSASGHLAASGMVCCAGSNFQLGTSWGVRKASACKRGYMTCSLCKTYTPTDISHCPGAKKVTPAPQYTVAPTLEPTVLKKPAYGCNSSPLTGQTSCANCAGLAFIKSHSLCTGCMRGTSTKITAANVGTLSPPALLCTSKTTTLPKTGSGGVCSEMFGPRKGSCPMARCSAPPAGCTYQQRYAPTGRGGCCPKLCYAVDEDSGEHCSSS